jgi:hypothetical protein
VLFPGITANQIFMIMEGCGAAGIVAAGYAFARRRSGADANAPIDRTGKRDWRMPPLTELATPVRSTGYTIGMGALRVYLLIAMILVIVKIVQVALGG